MHPEIHSKQDLMECCKAMQVLARGVVSAREKTVEIDRRPDLVLEDIHAAIERPCESHHVR